MADKKGGRPALRLVAVSKEKGGDGRRVYTEVGAAWASDQVEGSFNLRLAEGTRIRNGAGVTFSAETHFFNVEPPRPPKDAQPAADNSDF